LFQSFWGVEDVITRSRTIKLVVVRELAVARIRASVGLDDDRDLIVAAVTEPVKWHGQVATMNWRRGLFRLWIVGSALFVIAVAFISYSEIKSYAEVPWAKLEMCATIAFGIPLVVLILGWAFLGSAANRS
jgi:hypothetical protein